MDVTYNKNKIELMMIIFFSRVPKGLACKQFHVTNTMLPLGTEYK